MDQKQEKVNQIIEAATSVFSESGYAGARMDLIAERAGVNKATIYYNIGNKEQLYEAVLRAIFNNELSVTGEKIRNAASPQEKLTFYIMGIAEAIDRNPAIPNIIMWEHASGGVTLPEIIVTEIAKLIEGLSVILAEGEKQGDFIKMNPMLVQFMIVPGLMFYKTSTPIRNRNNAFPELARNLPHAVSEKFAHEMSAFILNGLSVTHNRKREMR
jgi:AcrR family transcriptional regulator